jgi:probable F420-dependent oxidoreductase
MRFSLGLPTDRVDAPHEFLTAAAVGEIAAAAEAAGFDAVFVTEHPMPSDDWLGGGGHHALDPFVALSFAAAATTRVRVQTNLAVVPYRNPFLLAKAAASLDVLSGGRLILGVGSGYLEPEFRALGAPFTGRNGRVDDALVAMKLAWTGERVVHEGLGYAAEGNVALPRPVQQPHPPIWVGGNGPRAMRRAVEHGDGWMPMPAPARFAARVRTTALESLDDLAARVKTLREHAATAGRTQPLDVMFTPITAGTYGQDNFSLDALLDEIAAQSEIGVTQMVIGFARLGAHHGMSRARFVDLIAQFGDEVVQKVPR